MIELPMTVGAQSDQVRGIVHFADERGHREVPNRANVAHLGMPGVAAGGTLSRCKCSPSKSAHVRKRARPVSLGVLCLLQRTVT